MSKKDEIGYFAALGDDGQRHAMEKPFSDNACGLYLMQIGAVMSLLPPPPATLLDVGCGTGWTSRFFARHGYTVTGIDISPDMIDCANRTKKVATREALSFVVQDCENITLDRSFDCAVFFDSLHHTDDEACALQQVYAHLVPGALCVVSEPGKGHHRTEESHHAMTQYHVTEKEMHPRRVITAAKHAGFREFTVYPHASTIGKALYSSRRAGLQRFVQWRILRTLAMMWVTAVHSRRNGIVVCTK